MADPTIAEVIVMCERVLAADISPEELQRLWPDESEDPSMNELRETLFSGLEHLPGKRGRGPWQFDREMWQRMPEYHDIKLYLRRLREPATAIEAEVQEVARQVVREVTARGYDALREQVPRTRRLLGINFFFERRPFMDEVRHGASGEEYRVIASLSWEGRVGGDIEVAVEVQDLLGHTGTLEEVVISQDGQVRES